MDFFPYKFFVLDHNNVTIDDGKIILRSPLDRLFSHEYTIY